MNEIYTHSHTHNFLVNTVCPKTRKEIKLTVNGDVNKTEGKPVECDNKQFCGFSMHPMCYLNAISIKGKRTRKRRKNQK